MVEKARGSPFVMIEEQVIFEYFFKYTLLLYPNVCYHNFNLPNYNQGTKS